ncbi:MAG: DUF502 domain-containing protein [Proteobacteria bacterium]|nr:DUF502 domain-containing protein [Pseudomonadota bacterium]
MKFISRIFLTGLFTVLPVLATIYLLVWLFTTAESFMGYPLQMILPDGIYVVGMGLVAGCLGVFLIGILMRAYFIRFIFDLTERFFLKVPLIKTIYSALREFFGLFTGDDKGENFQVVMVDMPNLDVRLLGFLTREEFSDLPFDMVPKGCVAVYLPMSYQIGGYTIFVPRSRLTPVDMPREQAMRLIITAGIQQSKKND